MYLDGIFEMLDIIKNCIDNYKACINLAGVSSRELE